MMSKKKRGGRRGKAKTSEQGGTTEPQPSTSLQPTPSPIKKKTEGEEPTKPEPSTSSPPTAIKKEEEEQFHLHLLKPATAGRKIQVITNYTRLDVALQTQFFLYDVTIEPLKKPKAILRKVMEQFKKAFYPENYPHYDGFKLLFSGRKLPLENNEAKSDVILEEGNSQKFNVSIKLVKVLDSSPVHNLLQKKNICNLEEILRCVEGALKETYIHSFVNFGRRFFLQPSKNEFPLGCGAEMYTGGHQAVIQGEQSLFLNVDVANKAFTTDLPLSELIIQMFSSRNQSIDLRTFKFNFLQLEEFLRYVKGLKVIYEIPKQPGGKTYKINNLANNAYEEMFNHEDTRISVFDYFKTKRNVILKFPLLPTLQCGNQKKICIPIEFCRLKEGQALEGSRLKQQQTSEMIRYTATSTSERKAKILKLLEQAKYNQNKCVAEFGITVNGILQVVGARVLDPPKLQYSDGQVTPQRGAWWGKKFKFGTTIKEWRLIGYGIRDNSKVKISDFARSLQASGTALGMVIGEATKPIPILNTYKDLNDCLERFKKSDFIIVVIQDKNDYFPVKKIAEKQVGCLTQCIKIETILYKMNQTTINNILLKINAKNNGINHSLVTFTKGNCMMMGADVTHPGSQFGGLTPSVAAVVSSLDSTATSYHVSAFLQKPHDRNSEIIQNLTEATMKSLQLFSGGGSSPPASIYFYRDGVADGDFKRIKDEEIQAIRSACNRFKVGYKPKLTFIVVQKRHHTRFFPTGRDSTAERDRNENVPIGTCVDSVITNPNFPNFFLLSHQSIKGVGRPTRYCVLFDENELSMDELQKMTLSLCHVYVRCNRSVRYPAPTYFADLAAERVKGYLFGENVNLEDLNQGLIKVRQDFQKKYPMFFV